MGLRDRIATERNGTPGSAGDDGVTGDGAPPEQFTDAEARERVLRFIANGTATRSGQIQ